MRNYIFYLLFSGLLLTSPTPGTAQDFASTNDPTSREQALTDRIYQDLEPKVSDGLQKLFSRNPFISALPVVETPQAPVETSPTTDQAQPSTDTTTEPVAEITPPNVLISGIVWNTDKPQAIVDGRVVGVGDTIAEGAVITAIEQNSIVITIGEQEFKIKPTIGTTNQFASTSSGPET